MGALLKLIGLGAGFNPLTVAIAAAVIFAVGTVTGFATGWQVNGWKLGKELAEVRGDLRVMTAQAQICADKLQTQNEATDALGALGDLIRGGTRSTLDAIEKGAAGQRAELGRLRGLMGKPTPTKSDGTKSDCNDAWREIEQRRAQP